MGGKDLGFHKGAGEGDSTEELLARIAELHPIELEERIETLARPLILEVACPGWQPKDWGPPQIYPVKKPVGYKEGGVRYPAVPCSVEDQAQAIIDSVKLGCQAVHIHPRDPKDCIASHEAELLRDVYERIFKKVDCISIQHTWQRDPDGEVVYTDSYAENILKVGHNTNKYCQGAVVLWPPVDAYPPKYTRFVQDGIRYMEERHIKPIHKLRSTYSVRKLQRVLIDTHVETKRPLVLVHDMGHPFGWPLDMDPWMPIDMITSIVQTRQRLGEDNVIGVFSGGRNWMPITITAIMMGVDFVRVGIEDCFWMYPHKDEVIQRNTDCVKKIIDVCKIIGRELATVDQAREILGITRTYK